MYAIHFGDLFGFIVHPHRVGIHSSTQSGRSFHDMSWGFSYHRLHELIFAAGDGEGEEARWARREHLQNQRIR